MPPRLLRSDADDPGELCQLEPVDGHDSRKPAGTVGDRVHQRREPQRQNLECRHVYSDLTQTIPVSFVSSSQLTGTIPGSLLAQSGTASISVVNPSGKISNAATFTVGSPPAISTSGGLTPSNVNAGGAGFHLTVQGANFVAGSIVQWDDGTGPSATNPSSL